MKTIVDDDGVMHEVYTKKEVMSMLENMKSEIEKLETFNTTDRSSLYFIIGNKVSNILDKHIAEIKGE